MTEPLTDVVRFRAPESFTARTAALLENDADHHRIGVTMSDIQREIYARGLLQMEQARRVGGKG